MNGDTYSGFTRQERNAPRVTARATRTEFGAVHIEYELNGDVYMDAEAVEAALRGEM